IDGLAWSANTPRTVERHVSGTDRFGGFANPTWTGTRYVANALRSFSGVVGDGGYILVSDDAVHWVERETRDYGPLNGLAQSPSGTLAFRGDLLQSPDAQNWTTRLLGARFSPFENRGVSWSVDRFLQVDPDGALVVSKDGLAWERHWPGSAAASALTSV